MRLPCSEPVHAFKKAETEHLEQKNSAFLTEKWAKSGIFRHNYGEELYVQIIDTMRVNVDAWVEKLSQ